VIYGHVICSSEVVQKLLEHVSRTADIIHLSICPVATFLLEVFIFACMEAVGACWKNAGSVQGFCVWIHCSLTRRDWEIFGCGWWFKH